MHSEPRWNYRLGRTQTRSLVLFFMSIWVVDKKLINLIKLSNPVHTNNDKDNYKDKVIHVHNSERYCLFILSKLILELGDWKKKSMILFLCAFIVIAVVWTLLLFYIENDFRTIFLLLSL